MYNKACCTCRVFVLLIQPVSFLTFSLSSPSWHFIVPNVVLSWLEKTAAIWQSLHWFSRQMTSEERAQKFHTDDASLPRSG